MCPKPMDTTWTAMAPMVTTAKTARHPDMPASRLLQQTHARRQRPQNLIKRNPHPMVSDTANLTESRLSEFTKKTTPLDQGVTPTYAHMPTMLEGNILAYQSRSS